MSDGFQITFGHDFNKLVGYAKLDDNIQDRLARGEELVLSAILKEDENGKRHVIGLTLYTTRQAQLVRLYD